MTTRRLSMSLGAMAMLLAAIGLGACRTAKTEKDQGELWREVANRINHQYQIQMPLQRMLENIAVDIDNGRSDLAAQKLRCLSCRITAVWSVAGNLPANYEEAIMQGSTLAPPVRLQDDDPFSVALPTNGTDSVEHKR